MTNSYLVILSETDKRNAFGADGKIKALITDYPMWINPKGKDQFEISSYHRVVQLTNTADPTKTSKDDRRNYILRCNDELKDNDEYFIDLNAALARPNALRSIYWSFKIMDISTWNFRKVPRTKYHDTIIEHTKNPMTVFLEAFTLQRMKMTECVMTGSDLLKEFRKWRETTGYKFEDNMNEGVLLKKIKTECDLPDGTFQKGNRTKSGFKQTINITALKTHFKLGCLLLKGGEFVEMEAEVEADDHEEGDEVETEGEDE
jgi:phage/plasmid-associated DNA primase